MCLGDEFTGAEVYFRGVRDAPWTEHEDVHVTHTCVWHAAWCSRTSASPVVSLTHPDEQARACVAACRAALSWRPPADVRAAAESCDLDEELRVQK